MKLLLDQNLPRSLLRRIPDSFDDSLHVADVGLAASTDREIYDYAGEHGLTILSKDSDFRQLSFLIGAPPKVIWIRIGNSTVRELVDCIVQNTDAISAFGATSASFLVIEPPTRE